MLNIRKASLFLLIVLPFGSCRKLSNEELMLKTTNNVLNAIKNNDSKEFVRLIGVRDLSVIGEDEEGVKYLVGKLHEVFGPDSLFNQSDIVVTDLYNSVGQRIVRITNPGFSNAYRRVNVHLSLLFGPPHVMPLDKISGYLISTNLEDSTDFRPLKFWNHK